MHEPVETCPKFSHCATSGKYLRKAAAGLSLTAKDSTSVARLTQVMKGIKNLDGTSRRGKRRVEIGIQTPEGLALLNGFNFNDKAPIFSVLIAPYTVTTATGEIRIPALIPAENLQSPPAATHLSLMAVFINIDLDTGKSNFTESPITSLPIDLIATSVIDPWSYHQVLVFLYTSSEYNSSRK